MANVLVLTSGNGGVGKTTSTAALGAALARCSDTVVVVDFDVGPRNLHLVMGAERRVVFDFIDVMHGAAMLSQALIRDESLDTLWVLPASQTRDKDALTADGVAKVIEEIRRGFDWVLCDSPAGIERGETHAIRHADSPPSSSPTQKFPRVIDLLDAKTERGERGGQVEKYLLITRYDPAPVGEGEMPSIEDVLEILDIPLLGVCRRSKRCSVHRTSAPRSRYATPQVRRPVPIAPRHAGSRARTYRLWYRGRPSNCLAGSSDGGLRDSI
jgi:septum site-determining protein MinD